MFAGHQSLFAERFLQRAVGGKGSGSRTAGSCPPRTRFCAAAVHPNPGPNTSRRGQGQLRRTKAVSRHCLWSMAALGFRGMLLLQWQREDEASCSGERLWGSRMAAFLDCIFQQQQSNPLFRFSHLKSLQKPRLSEKEGSAAPASQLC